MTARLLYHCFDCDVRVYDDAPYPFALARIAGPLEFHAARPTSPPADTVPLPVSAGGSTPRPRLEGEARPQVAQVPRLDMFAAEPPEWYVYVGPSGYHETFSTWSAAMDAANREAHHELVFGPRP